MPIFDCPFEIVLVIPCENSVQVFCTLTHDTIQIPFDYENGESK